MKKSVLFFLLILIFIFINCYFCKSQKSIEITTTDISDVQIVDNTNSTVPIEQPKPTEPLEIFQILKYERLPFFSEDYYFKYEYVESEKRMPYALFSPSHVSEKNPAGLIIWLHGGGERNCTVDWYKNAGLQKVLNNWNLYSFNAYVVCPHLRGKWNPGYWNHPTALQQVKELVDYFVEFYHIDSSKIVIAGHSLGGLGAIYMAAETEECFSKVVVMSSVNPKNIDLNKITIPILGCVETDYSDGHFMNKKLASLKKCCGIWKYDAKHNLVPQFAFLGDKDNNNCSDLVEWMFDK